MNLTIHRGSSQIGGSCVEVESQGKRLLIDLSDMSERTGNHDLFRKISRIQNNKGSLCAYWREAPTENEKTVLEKA